MSAKAHADLGASSAHRWMVCPGSIRQSAGMPDNTSDYAREGTAAHTLLEKALRMRLDAATWLDTEIPVRDADGTEHHILVTEEMCDAVQVCIDQVLALIDHPTTELFIEVRFDLSALNPPGPMFGTADVVVWAPYHGHLAVVDLKYGAGVVVDATENEQLMMYALGAVVALDKQPKTMSATIVQPRAHHPDGIVRSFVFNFPRLAEFKKELFAAAARTTDPNAELVPGDHCKFCKGQATCPAQRQLAIEVAQSEFDTPGAVLPAPERLTDEQVTKILMAKPTMTEWFRAIEQHQINRLNRGEEVPGWKLVPKRASRKWADPEQAEIALLAAGVPADELYKKKLVSPAQAEAALKPLKVKLDDIERATVVKESSGFNLAPDTDPRPALLSSASSDFDATTPNAVNQEKA